MPMLWLLRSSGSIETASNRVSLPESGRKGFLSFPLASRPFLWYNVKVEKVIIMKLTDTSLSILKNFSGINPNLYVNPGNVIKTRSQKQELAVKATIDVNFPVEFGIFDMGQFLSSIALVENAELEFSERSVEISGDGTRLKYNYSDKNALCIFETEVKMPEAKLEFTLKAADLDRLKSAASVLGHDDITFINVDGNLTARVDTVTSMNKNVASNTFDIDLGVDAGTADFCYVVKLGQLVMLPGDYTIKFASPSKTTHLAEFSSQQHELQYWIGLQRESYYND